MAASTTSSVLVLGGARSGKSEVGESLAARLAPAGAVTYLATGPLPDADADPAWARRVEVHQNRRPPQWSTESVSGPALTEALHRIPHAVLVDSLGAWVAGHDGFDVQVSALGDAIAARRAPTVVVSDEVGLGVVPSTEIGGTFRDALGEVNRAVAAVVDEVYLVVAGRLLRLERP